MNVSDSNDFMRSKKRTPSRWSVSCWITRAGRPCAVIVDALAVAIVARSRALPARAARDHECPGCSGSLPSRLPSARRPSVTSGLINVTSGMSASSLISDAVPAARTPATNSRSRSMDLRRRQADACIFVHGLEHVVDQALNARRPDLVRRNRSSLGTKHRVAHICHLQNRHVGDYMKKGSRIRDDVPRPGRRRRSNRKARTAYASASSVSAP